MKFPQHFPETNAEKFAGATTSNFSSLLKNANKSTKLFEDKLFGFVDNKKKFTIQILGKFLISLIGNLEPDSTEIEIAKLLNKSDCETSVTDIVVSTASSNSITGFQF